jgi:hypothetical protein
MSKNERSGLRQVIHCLKSPKSSFKSILEKPSLRMAAALIFVIAIIAAWAGYNYMGKLPLKFPVEGGLVNPEQIRQALMVVSVIASFISIFGGWFISSALLHAFSRFQGGKGTFKNMLTLAGYASTPLLIQNLLRLIDSFTVSQEELLRIAGTLQVSSQPFLNAIANIAINTFTIFRLWSMALIAIALRENYKISTSRSIATVIVTYIIMMFLSIILPF